jgi:hypothetical protein
MLLLKYWPEKHLIQSEGRGGKVVLYTGGDSPVASITTCQPLILRDEMKTHWGQGYSTHNFNMPYGENIGTRQGGDILQLDTNKRLTQTCEEIKV